MDSKARIKTGFIFSVIAQASVSFYITLLIVQKILGTYFMTSNFLISIAFVIMFVIAPIPLSIIALTYTRGVEVADNQDRTYRIIARVFANVTLPLVGVLLLAIVFLSSAIGFYW